MNTVLWILQGLMTLEFLFHGWAMLTLPASVTRGMAYMTAVQPGFRRFIGGAEILAAIGLILPALTRILPWLTPLAAVGLIIILVSAVVFHIQRKEAPNIILNLILLVLAVFIAYGRFVVVPL